MTPIIIKLKVNILIIRNKMTNNLIKIRVGDIVNNFNNVNLIFCDDKVEFTSNRLKIFLYLTLFNIFGLIPIFLFPDKTFFFIYRKTRLSYFNPFHFKISPKFLRRFIFILTYIINLFFYPFIILNYIILESDLYRYDWVGLYKSMKKEGYQPKKFNNGYIKVEKYKNLYYCSDGNHRHKVLEFIYDKDKIIEVIYEGIIFKNTY